MGPTLTTTRTRTSSTRCRRGAASLWSWHPAATATDRPRVGVRREGHLLLGRGRNAGREQSARAPARGGDIKPNRVRSGRGPGHRPRRRGRLLLRLGFFRRRPFRIHRARVAIRRRGAAAGRADGIPLRRSRRASLSSRASSIGRRRTVRSCLCPPEVDRPRRWRRGKSLRRESRPTRVAPRGWTSGTGASTAPRQTVRSGACPLARTPRSRSPPGSKRGVLALARRYGHLLDHRGLRLQRHRTRARKRVRAGCGLR